MLPTYLRRLFVAATVVAVGGAITTGVACTVTTPRKVPVGTTGAAGSTTGTGTAGSTTGAAGDSTTGTGTAGVTTGAAGDSTTGTGTAGSTTGAAGDQGAAGSTTGAAGDSSAAGTTGAAGTGAAGATVVDNSKVITGFPVPVTDTWYPSGWSGDGATMAAFTATPAPITITDQSNATTGPCSKRVAGHVGACFKITYTPVTSDAGATFGSVALIPNVPGGTAASFDATVAPHVPQGATRISAEVAGNAGGEVVQFNLWGTDSGDLFPTTFPADATAAQTWQKITLPLTGVSYDHVQSPFGWLSASTTPIVFYYDDVRIENTP